MKFSVKRYYFIVLTLILAFLSPASIAAVSSQAGPAMPELPREYLDTSYSLPRGGDRIFVSAGGDLQDALDRAQPGDVIELEAGATFTGNFKLHEKSGEGWIYIQTSAYGSLPRPGTRVSPELSHLMPKIVTPNENPAVTAVGNAHHFRFVGIEFGVAFNTRDNPNTGNTVWSIIQLNVDNPASVTELASDIYFDRVYIHGNPEANVRRGILANSRRTAVVDSYISDIHVYRFGSLPNGQDSQAFIAWNGPGPFKLVNNYLEASTENVMFGGAMNAGPEFVPSDIEFRRNYLFKPLAWRVENSGLGYDYWVKNIFELKNAQRVLVDSNVLENVWKGADQDGFAVLFTVRAEVSNPWNTISDVTFTNNVIRHASNAIQFLGQDVTASEGLNRILVRNNLFDDINGVKWSGSGWKDGWGFQMTSDNFDVTIDHNTILQTDLAFFLSGTTSPGFTFTNNIIQSVAKWNYLTFSAAGEAVRGKIAFDTYLPGHYVAKNMVAGHPYQDPAYPAGYFIDTTIEQAGFVNYNGGDGGNYRLTDSSPGKNRGASGKDIGADIDLLEAATYGVVDGAIGVQDIVNLCKLFLAKNGASSTWNGFENAAAHTDHPKGLVLALDNQINALENKKMLTKEQADVLHSLTRLQN